MDTNLEKTTYMKPYAILRLGNKVANIIADGYNSESAEDKLNYTRAILALDNNELAIAAKIKFIGDVMTRPKKERVKIANKLYLLLSEDTKTANIKEEN